MSWEFFTAKKIIFQRVNEMQISRPIINIAVIGIAIGMAVMILSIAIVTGFKDTIRQKVVGFGSHIEIINYDSNNSFENVPISRDLPFLPKIKKLPIVKHIQVFATKAGIIKTKTDFQGIVLKGVDKDYDWQFIKNNLVAGNIVSINDFEKNTGIIVSEKIANLLNLKLGDKMIIYFIEDPPRIRKFIIKGIYNTGLEEFDKLFAFVDIKHIQKLNYWTKDQVGGFEIGGIAGVIIGAAAKRKPVVVDGFISSAGALIAMAIEPFVRDYIICAHRSMEPGHAAMQEKVGCKPLLDLNLRLGEGTGAALAMNFVEAAVAVLTEVATFEEAAVAGADK